MLSAGVDSEIFVRDKDPKDSRRTLYRISEEMMAPLTTYFTNTLEDFDHLFSSVFDGLFFKSSSFTPLTSPLELRGFKKYSKE